jgi:hypothetical protein
VQLPTAVLVAAAPGEAVVEQARRLRAERAVHPRQPALVAMAARSLSTPKAETTAAMG